MFETSPQSRWVPLLWPSTWRQPKSLDWIAGTPINCLVFEAGLPDSDPLLAEARRRGLVIVDWRRAASSGIAVAEAAKIPWNGESPIAAITDAEFPGVRMSSARNRNAVDAGPTGAPWIDSNGWRIQLAHARAPEKIIWLVSKPQTTGEDMVIGNAYQLAVADAGASGARWLVSLDEQLAKDVEARDASALARWRGLVAALRFFEARRFSADNQPRAVAAIVSTFSGANEFLATEVLNLSARQNLIYRVLLTRQAASADFETLKAIIWVDEEPPEGALLGKLGAFVRAGGVLIAPTWAGKLSAAGRPVESPIPGYSLWHIGRGRIAVPNAPWEDPYRIATDAQILISHREDPLIVFNGGSLMARLSALSGGRGDLAELVRYSARSGGQPVTLRLRRSYASVQLSTLEAPAPIDIPPKKVREGVELELPSFDVFAALELRL